MDRMEYKCNICIKEYSSYKSLWLHNYKYHKQNEKNVVENVVIKGKNVVIEDKNNIVDNRTCKYCKKKLCDRKYRWKHEQKCKSKEYKKDEMVELKTEIEKLKQQINNPKYNIQNAHSITNNIDNSQKIINNFGNNNLDCLTDQFKKKLLKEFLFEEDYINPIPLLIEKINFNSDYKENNNAKISNLKSKIGYKYTGGKMESS